MFSHSWQLELSRFCAMSQMEQLIWLSKLLYLISMFARGTYEAGTDNVLEPTNLRRFNELIHRVAEHQHAVATNNAQRRPDEDLIALVAERLAALGVAEEPILRGLAGR